MTERIVWISVVAAILAGSLLAQSDRVSQAPSAPTGGEVAQQPPETTPPLLPDTLVYKHSVVFDSSRLLAATFDSPSTDPNSNSLSMWLESQGGINVFTVTTHGNSATETWAAIKAHSRALPTVKESGKQ